MQPLIETDDQQEMVASVGACNVPLLLLAGLQVRLLLKQHPKNQRNLSFIKRWMDPIRSLKLASYQKISLNDLEKSLKSSLVLMSIEMRYHNIMPGQHQTKMGPQIPPKQLKIRSQMNLRSKDMSHLANSAVLLQSHRQSTQTRISRLNTNYS